MKFKISTTTMMKYNPNNDKGIYLCNDKLLNYLDKDNLEKQETMRYRFNLAIIEDKEYEFGDVIEYETIDFTATLNLKDYIKEGRPDDVLAHIDFQKITSDFYPYRNYIFRVQRLKKRLELIKTPVHKDPVMITDLFGNKVEFLEFDDSAFEWGPPYDHGDKYGCAMTFGKNDQIESETLDFMNKLENKSPLEIVDIVSKISEDEEVLHRLYDFRIHLYGEDDCSYSIGFANEEDMLKEVQRLRDHQPLNIDLDVRTKYTFTN